MVRPTNRNQALASAQMTGKSSVLFWLLGFLIASTALISPYGQKLGGYAPDLHMSATIQVFGFALLSAVLFSWHRRRTIVFPQVRQVTMPLLLVYVWVVLSGLWVANFYEFFVDFLYWSGAFVCGLLTLLLVTNMKTLRFLLITLFISGFLNALLGIGQFLFGIDWVQQHVVPATTFSNKNMAGQYALLTLPLGIAFFLESKERAKFWFYAIASALMLAFIFYTRSRGIWISTVATAIIFSAVLLCWRYAQGHKLIRSPEKFYALGVALIVALTVASLTPKTFGFVEEVKKESIGQKSSQYEKTSGKEILNSVIAGTKNTASVRTTIWVNSIPMFVDHFFFGVGFGNWVAQYPKYQAWFRQDTVLLQDQYHANAHNDYVELICEFGFFGMLLLLWFFVNFFKVLVRVLGKSENNDFRMILLGPAMALLAISIDAGFSFPFKQPVPIMIIMTYVAVFCCALSIKQGSAGWRVINLPAPIYKRTGVVTAVVITLALLILQYQWYQSELNYRSALLLAESTETTKMKLGRDHAHKAYQYNKLDKQLLWLEGTALLKLGSVEKATVLLEKVLKAYPFNDITVQTLVSGYQRLGQHSKSLAIVNRMIKIQPYREGASNDSLEKMHLDLLLKLHLYGNAREILALQEYRIKQGIENLDRERVQQTKKVLQKDPDNKRQAGGLKDHERRLDRVQRYLALVDKKLDERRVRLAQPLETKPGE